MRLKSLKSKLLLAVSILVIASGLVITLLVTRQYSAALRQAMVGQVENAAQTIALDAADKILVNDLVALQKMLDQQIQSNADLGYILILRDGRVLAHTFERGVPEELLGANEPLPGERPHLREIVSQKGEYFLDAAWPIFGGKAGVLRLGVSEKNYRRQVGQLWLKIALFTLGVLLIAWMGSLLFVRRITRPLATLVQATQEIDRGEANVQVNVQGQDEIATLAASFNHMVRRQEEYTRRLEEQAMELERAHGQTVTACKIVQEVSALRTLDEMGAMLLHRLKDTILCQHLALALFSSTKEALYVLSGRKARIFNDPKIVKAVKDTLAGLKTVTFSRRKPFKAPIIPEDFHAMERQAIIPLSSDKVYGAAIVACPGKCACNHEEIERVRLILNQTAGALGRGVLHEDEVAGLKKRLEAATGFGDLIGKDPKMQVVYNLIEDVAPSDVTVLIQGESGTGKELVARAIHRHSPRKDGPFVVINCSAYPATLLESELFGHEKGAFTGALRQKAGRFEQAHGGTVFLDEVGDIPLPAQVKLLRVLQTRKFERVGGEQTLTIDVRILAASHKDLIQEVKNGNFREDLFYRLNVIPIKLPPLRERKNDIPLLIEHFLKLFAAARGKDIQGLSSEALRVLLNYSWPGNVRELENTMEHAVVLAKAGQVEAWDLPAWLQSGQREASPTLSQREEKALLDVLEECGWNKKMAAQRLGISRSTLYLMLKRHKISPSKTTTH
jgi:DNA-binding NtrC family response regulator/HAMP domain-containing protein|uniref:HAMP domain-containing protein n=1 Tax=Desulfobacca acetoxidans TaxID=60893 RepID=A0A7V6DPF5_9BACT